MYIMNCQSLEVTMVTDDFSAVLLTMPLLQVYYFQGQQEGSLCLFPDLAA